MIKKTVVIAWAVIGLWGIAGNSLRAGEIRAVWGEQSSYARGNIYWFVEGINATQLFYDDGQADLWQYVTTEKLNPVIAVKFDSLQPPLLITGIGILISERDYFPDLPGDCQSPFDLAVAGGTGSEPDTILAGPCEVQASAEWEEGGQWISAALELLLSDRDCFWGEMIWNPNFPAAPLIGLDYNSPPQKSVFGYFDQGWQWSNCAVGGYMIRAEVILNDLDGITHLKPGAEIPDSFRIYGSGQSQVYASPEFYDTTVIGKLHCRVKLPSPENYFCITAFLNDLESVASRIVMIPGGTQRRADVRFAPRSAQLGMAPGTDTSFSLILTNKNGRTINYRIEEVNILPAPSSDPPTVVIYAPQGTIGDDQADTIRLGIGAGPQAAGEYQLSLIFGLWDSLQGYLDEQYDIFLTIDELTAVEDPAGQLPSGFYLGQNFPNPFNSQTAIPLAIPESAGTALLEIFDILGKPVSRRVIAPGFRGNICWDARNREGELVSAGMYLLRLKVDSQCEVRKLLLLK